MGENLIEMTRNQKQPPERNSPSAFEEAISNATPPASPTVPQVVRLEFRHPAAKRVCIAGSFNDWRPGVSEMIWLGDDRWGKELALPPGAYEYLLWVDGQWMPDPNARATVPNSYGGRNCVLVVSAPGSQQ